MDFSSPRPSYSWGRPSFLPSWPQRATSTVSSEPQNQLGTPHTTPSTLVASSKALTVPATYADPPSGKEFDSTLGYPGEGPPVPTVPPRKGDSVKFTKEDLIDVNSPDCGDCECTPCACTDSHVYSRPLRQAAILEAQAKLDSLLVRRQAQTVTPLTRTVLEARRALVESGLRPQPTPGDARVGAHLMAQTVTEENHVSLPSVTSPGSAGHAYHEGDSTTSTTLKGAAIDTVHAFSTSAQVESLGAVPPANNIYGLPGDRVRFSQKLITVGTAAANTNVFMTGTPAESGGGTAIFFAPEYLNGPFVGRANWYEFYAIRRVRLVYVTALKTSNAVIAFGITSDVTGDAAPTTFDNICALSKYKIVPAGIEAEIDIADYEYTGTEIYRCSTSGQPDPQDRQFNLYGVAATAAAGATTYGYITAQFEVDFYEPTDTQALAIIRCDSISQLLLASYAAQLRAITPVRWGTQYEADDLAAFKVAACKIKMSEVDRCLTEPQLALGLFGSLIKGVSPVAHLAAKVAKSKLGKAAIGVGRRQLSLATGGASETAISGARELGLDKAAKRAVAPRPKATEVIKKHAKRVVHKLKGKHPKKH